MCTVRQILNQVRKQIAIADKILLDGLNYPSGRTSTFEEHAKEKRESSIAVVTAYNLLKQTEKINQKLLNHLYYLARDIACAYDDLSYEDYIFSAGKTPQEIIDQIRAIAKEGRQYFNPSDVDILKRVREKRLFILRDDIFPLQIRDSKRGCSATICSNCYEPIAIATRKCPCCKFETIGPFSAHIEIERWEKLNRFEKERIVENVYFSNDYGKIGEIERGGRMRVFVLNKWKDYLSSPQ